MLDVLDESEKAFVALRKPLTEEQKLLARLDEEDEWASEEVEGLYAGNPVGY
jgi:hypothetical protein